MSEVDDFLHRHLDDIAEAMKEPDVVHSPRCTHGKRVWMFNRYWPFIHTWISTCVCVCEINDILRRAHKSDCAVHNEPAFPNGPCDCADERARVVPVREITYIDVADREPEQLLRDIRQWKEALRKHL
jgi:hypothetical protein